jgi:hypothetical protein
VRTDLPPAFVHVRIRQTCSQKDENGKKGRNWICPRCNRSDPRLSSGNRNRGGEYGFRSGNCKGDHLFCDSLRSSARSAHAPRSLHAPVHSITGLPTGNASPFPGRSESAAFPRRLLSLPSALSSASVPQPLLRLHSERSTSSNGLPEPARCSASDRANFSSA